MEIYSDEETTRYLGGVKTAEESRDMLDNRILKYYGEHPGLGMWVTLKRSSGACIGFHLLNHVRGEAIIQVGYSLLPQYWGRGYATEMSIALLRYGYTELSLPLITANTHRDHIASQRVLQKCGLHRKADRSFSHPAYANVGPSAYFERCAQDWLAENSSTTHHRDRA